MKTLKIYILFYLKGCVDRQIDKDIIYANRQVPNTRQICNIENKQTDSWQTGRYIVRINRIITDKRNS